MLQTRGDRTLEITKIPCRLCKSSFTCLLEIRAISSLNLRHIRSVHGVEPMASVLYGPNIGTPYDIVGHILTTNQDAIKSGLLIQRMLYRDIDPVLPHCSGRCFNRRYSSQPPPRPFNQLPNNEPVIFRRFFLIVGIYTQI